MKYKIRDMTYGKRGSKTKQKYPDFFGVTGFKKESYAKCVVYVQIGDEEYWLSGVSIYNHIKKTWSINAIDKHYNQVVLDVL